LALGVEYDGSAFHGWQRQSHSRSIQQTLEEALGRIAARPIRVTASGRTDAGVHATQQIVAFDTSVERPIDAWVRGTNSLLPDDVRVLWAVPVPNDFHPRFSASARRYLYVFVEAERSPAIARQYATWSERPLDDAAMHAAGRGLIGEHDFTTFRSAACQAKSPYRCVFSLEVRRFTDLVVIDIAANAFLQHMVRNIAGALADVGRGDRPVAWVAQSLTARDRARIGITAPPVGLYLHDVSYGSRFDFPHPRPPTILRAAGNVW
jgi:tRNA pseudouridine38-40 synthase